MRAVRMHSFGDPDVLQFEEVDKPSPGRKQVLVEVHAASVNPVDWKIREGSYPAVEESDLPIVPGRDIAGKVVELGDDVTDVKIGQQVFAFLDMDTGGYGDYAVVDVRFLSPKPRGLTMTEAAAVPLAAMTAAQGLFDCGGLRRGQRVLIHGGAGGVGHLAIQIAKTRGAWVATTVRQIDMDFVTRLGADQVVDYQSERFEDVVRPVDLVLDLVGGETQDRSFEIIVPGGRLVSTLGEPDPQKAREYGIRSSGFVAKPNGKQLFALANFIDQGQIRVEVQRTYPLRRAAEAQQFQKTEHSRGKTVLEVRL